MRIAGKKGLTAMLAAGMLLGVAPAAAQGFEAPDGTAPLLSLGAGAFDVTDDETNTAADFRLELRPDLQVLAFKPWAGVELTSDGGLWGGGGVLVDVYFGRHFVVTGSTGVGGYEPGDGKDLGATVEFRSQLELAYRFDDRSRLGVAFGHLSNAGIGDDNPGAETATLYYHVPLAKLAGFLE